MGKSISARGPGRRLYSHQVKEDYFRMDRMLGDCLRGESLNLLAEPAGILLRTMLLGESANNPSIRPLSRTETNGIPYLTLFYSRFFELAPWFEPPPGPRPIIGSSLNPEFLFKFGILLHVDRDKALLNELNAFMDGNGLSAMRSFLESPDEDPAVYLGFQIMNRAPFECRIVHYFPHCKPSTYYKKTSALAYFQPLKLYSGLNSRSQEEPGAVPENLHVEAFYRAHTSSAFAPDLSKLPDQAPAPGSGKKVVFKQRGLPVLHGRAVCFYIRSMTDSR